MSPHERGDFLLKRVGPDSELTDISQQLAREVPHHRVHLGVQLLFQPVEFDCAVQTTTRRIELWVELVQIPNGSDWLAGCGC